MNNDVKIDIELEGYADMRTDGFVEVVASNSAIAAVGPGPGPGNSAIAAVGPGPSPSDKLAAGSGDAAGPLVSWSQVTPSQ